MAQIVLGIGTSHSPMLSLKPEQWGLRADADKAGNYLVDPDDGQPVAYADLLARRAGATHEVSLEIFERQWRTCQNALAQLRETLIAARPDTLVIISDDQEELFFDDNMPMFNIYWGDTIRLVPRIFPPGAGPDMHAAAWGYGDVEMDVPVDSALGLQLITSLREQEFDISHTRSLHPDLMYGGAVGPSGYIAATRRTAARRQGMGHGWAFVIKRLLDNQPIPIVPVHQNTCYPPNTPTARRCYRFGQALRQAIESWDAERRVAVIASGGLSHFVTDELLDRLLLRGVLEKDPAILSTLPEQRLQSAASEIKNWVTCAAACEHLQPELLSYVPLYRTEAGTGGGWAFVSWQ